MFKYRFDQFEFPCEEGTEFVESFVPPLLVLNIEDHGVFSLYNIDHIIWFMNRLNSVFENRHDFFR